MNGSPSGENKLRETVPLMPASALTRRLGSIIRPITSSFEGDDSGLMHDSVDRDCGYSMVAEDFPQPRTED